MNYSTLPAEDDQNVLDEPNNNITESSNSSLTDGISLASPIHDDHDDQSSMLLNSTTNSSDLIPTGMNNTEQGRNETNSSGFTWDMMQNWNDSRFWDRSGGWGDPLINSTNTTSDVMTAGPTNWEGYILGIFCMGTAMLSVLAPAWYMDRRRHLEFVGRERREARSQRRRRRRRWNRRARRQYWARRMLMMDDLVVMGRQEAELVDGQEASAPLTEEYILGRLVTRPLQASDLCIDDQKPDETPSLKKLASDKTDDTVTSSSNKDPDVKDDEDDDESFDLDEDDNEDSSSLDDEDADCCAICLGGYKIGDEICYPTESRPCSHFFHRTCLVPWLLKQNVCPCCRVQYLPSPPAEIREEQDENELVVDVDSGGEEMPGTLEDSNEQIHPGAPEIESDDPMGIEVNIGSSIALTPELENSSPLECSVVESDAGTRGTRQEVPACEKVSDENESAVLLLDMTARSNNEEGIADSSIRADNNIEYDAMPNDVDLEAQTPLPTTSCDEEKEEAHGLDGDTDSGVHTMTEQANGEDEIASDTAELDLCTPDQPPIIRKASSSDEETLISA